MLVLVCAARACHSFYALVVRHARVYACALRAHVLCSGTGSGMLLACACPCVHVLFVLMRVLMCACSCAYGLGTISDPCLSDAGMVRQNK